MTDFPAVVYIKAPEVDDAVGKSKNLTEKNEEPFKKKQKVNNLLADERDYESLKEFLINFNKDINKKLDNIEKQVDILSDNYDALDVKVENVSSMVSKHIEDLRTAVVNRDNTFNEDGTGPAIPVSSKVTFITLNREEDYPNGTWLGDPENPECRVRCIISPTDLFHIHTTCTTAEKMALTLLDYLFDRETQARSNISGMGKHKKKQLNPLLVYGMKCHLNFHFGMTEQEWNKIKQNLDSKCRTAFRRKIKGLPLAPKNVHQNNTSHPHMDTETILPDSVSPGSIVNSDLTDQLSNDTMTFHVIKAENEDNILERAIKEGDFQILNATPEEVADIKHSLQF
ncbi:hypothetical protein CDAR_290601 [Caerostris darwini]|uniref:Protein BANP n=1 Tax=Caerostris darwini TaxID=1538125 RepID=A0AAV4N746_9ARAC|nr:hypothetical protein CDAR_290601 [Caerostris darwini]